MFFARLPLRARAFSTRIKVKVDADHGLINSVRKIEPITFSHYLSRMENPKFSKSVQLPTLAVVAIEFRDTTQRLYRELGLDKAEVDYKKYDQFSRVVNAYGNMLNSLRPYHEPADYVIPIGVELKGATAMDTPLSILAGIDDVFIADYFFRLMDEARTVGNFSDFNLNGEKSTNAVLPLVAAVQTGCENTVYSLTVHGANPKVVNQQQQSVLDIAHSLGRTRVIACLLDAINNPRVNIFSKNKLR